MTTKEFQFRQFDLNDSNINNDVSEFTQAQQDQVYSIVRKELTRDILNLQESISKYNFAYDAKMNNKFVDIEKKMQTINDKIAEVSNSVNILSIKITKIEENATNISKIKDQLTSQEIRLNNTTKDLGEACYKYDKMYLDNLILPGHIGDCCKFKNLREFLDYSVNQFGQFDLYKEKNTVDLKTYKERIEILIGKFNKQFENFNKASYDYTNLKIAEVKEYIKEIAMTINAKFPEIQIKNSNYFMDAKKEINNLMKERDDLKSFKNEIVTMLDANYKKVTDSNVETSNKIGEYKTEFAKIKRNFLDIAEFIKDVRFKKNINNEAISSNQLKKLALNLTKEKKENLSADKRNNIIDTKVDDVINDITKEEKKLIENHRRTQSAKTFSDLFSDKENKPTLNLNSNTQLNQIFEEGANSVNNNSQSNEENSQLDSINEIDSDGELDARNFKEIEPTDKPKPIQKKKNLTVIPMTLDCSPAKELHVTIPNKKRLSSITKVRNYSAKALNRTIKPPEGMKQLIEESEKRMNNIEFNTKIKLIELENKLNNIIPNANTINTTNSDINRLYSEINNSNQCNTSPNQKKRIIMTQSPINIIMNTNIGNEGINSNFKNYLNFHPSKIKTKVKHYSFSKSPNEAKAHLFEMRSGDDSKSKQNLKKTKQTSIPVSRILEKDTNSNRGISSNLSSHFLKPLKNCLENIPQINPLQKNNQST